MSVPITPDEMNMVPPLDFEVLDGEPWIKIRVSDGTVIKVRTIVVMIKRLPGKNPDGTTKYAVMTNTVIRTFETPLKLNR